MKQISLPQSGFEIAKKTTPKRVFAEEINKVVPWRTLVSMIEPHAPPAEPVRQGGRPALDLIIRGGSFLSKQHFSTGATLPVFSLVLCLTKHRTQWVVC